MARAALDVLGSRVRSGLVVGVEPSALPAPLEGIVGGHPMPSPASEDAGKRALAIAEAAGADEELLVLLSGGASALMAAPAEGLTLDDKRRTTDTLLRAGADIHALNTVRKHLSTNQRRTARGQRAGPVPDARDFRRRRRRSRASLPRDPRCPIRRRSKMRWTCFGGSGASMRIRRRSWRISPAAWQGRCRKRQSPAIRASRARRQPSSAAVATR